MRVTITQFPNDDARREAAWQALVDHARGAGSELVLLPEMPFHPWLAASPAVDPEAWAAAVAAHDAWIPRLAALAPAAAVTTCPVVAERQRLNRAILHDPATMPPGTVRAVHDKYHLPDEADFWEATWYQRGNGRFDPAVLGDTIFGVQICTDMWFFEHGRAYGQGGAHLILVPRATPRESRERWITGARALAMVSGAFVLSSNNHAPVDAAANLGGYGFCIDPDGQVLATTSETTPFVTVEIDLAAADAAKETYPRYVRA